MKGKTVKIILTFIITTATLISAGSALALHSNTMVAWWKPCALCLVIASGGTLLLNKLIKQAFSLRYNIFNFLIAFIFTFSLLIGLFYSINYYASDKESSQQQSVKVIDKFSEEHYRVKRVSRHAVARDEKYKVYYIVIGLPDGHEKKISLSMEKYAKIRVGKDIRISIEKGFFGVPVIKKYDFPINRHKKTNKRNRLQKF